LFEGLQKNGVLREKTKLYVPLCYAGDYFVDEGGHAEVKEFTSHAKTACDEMEVWLHCFLFSALDH
jgi:hypothetical protein